MRVFGFAGEAQRRLMGGQEQAEAEGFDGEGGGDEDEAQGVAVQEHQRGQREDPSRDQEHTADRSQNCLQHHASPLLGNSELTAGFL